MLEPTNALLNRLPYSIKEIRSWSRAMEIHRMTLFVFESFESQQERDGTFKLG